MRKLFFICSLLFHFGFDAQTDIYAQLKQKIKEIHPEIVTDDKLLAFNIWSSNDPESREANKSFDKVYTVYEYAKLKGGLRGIVVIAINKENLSSMATIAFTKDGIHKLISLGLESLESADLKTNTNMVFDSTGNLIYKNLLPSKIFSSVNQLITR